LDNPSRPLILFDGVCHLCHGSVQFVLKRDVAGRFDFAPLQSKLGQEKLNHRNWDSMALVEDGQVYEAEAGVLRVLARLSRPWPWIATMLGWLPRPVLRWGYRTVARNRYRWFGREEVCMLPRPEWKGRFLE
jgi:predicted DCC family thiol-disulfide oxidoreductase YuxK